MPRAIEYRKFDCKKQKLDGKPFANSWFSLLAEIYGMSRELIEQREKRRQIKRRRIRAVAATGAIAAISAAAVLISASQAEAARRRLSRGLASEAQVLMAKEPALMERAALLGAESLHRLPTPEGDQVVRSPIGLLPRLIAEFPYAANVTTAALSPDGAYAAVAGDQGVDVFLSVDKRMLAHVADGTVVFSTLFSSDGKSTLFSSDG